MKLLYCSIAFILLSGLRVSAQEKAAEKDSAKKHTTITIGPGGVSVSHKLDSVKKEEKPFEMHFFMLDLGINAMQDKTDYASSAAQAFLPADATPGKTATNSSLFDLRTGKSVNVNLWPCMAKFRIMKSKRQKIYISTGVGLQMYNYRFTKNISYKNDVAPHIIMDSVSFSKNKLGLTYLSVPLGLTFKTRLAEKAWLVYGGGITGGYLIGSWTKQISQERGKQKQHDQYNFADFNSCVTGEFGIEGYFRLYISYQLTALHETALAQHPFCIGIRFGGV